MTVVPDIITDLIVSPQRRACAALADPMCVVIDCETTGLDETAEIIELAVIDRPRTSLADQLIRPLQPIPAENTVTHGLRAVFLPLFHGET